MEQKLEILFEFKESRSIICCERPEISDEVELKMSRILGVDTRPRVFVLASRARRYTTAPYYLLQRWVEKWKCYINVDSLEQIKSEDRLSVTLNKENKVRPCMHALIHVVTSDKVSVHLKT